MLLSPWATRKLAAPPPEELEPEDGEALEASAAGVEAVPAGELVVVVADAVGAVVAGGAALTVSVVVVVAPPLPHADRPTAADASASRERAPAAARLTG